MQLRMNMGAILPGTGGGNSKIGFRTQVRGARPRLPALPITRLLEATKPRSGKKKKK